MEHFGGCLEKLKAALWAGCAQLLVPGASLPISSLSLPPLLGRAPSHRGEVTVTAEGRAWGGFLLLRCFAFLGGIEVYIGGGCPGEQEKGS